MTNPMAKLRFAVAWVIVGVWVGTLVLNAVAPNYDVPPTVHGLMLLVAGFLFGPTITGGRREKLDDQDANS